MTGTADRGEHIPCNVRVLRVGGPCGNTTYSEDTSESVAESSAGAGQGAKTSASGNILALI